MNVISRLMRPQRVAVIGASADIASLPAVPDVGIVLSASGALEMDHFPSGAVSVVSQNGGILGSLLSRAAARGIGLSKLISTSNEVDLELADFIEWLIDDEATKVIALYVESVRNTEKFRQAAIRAAAAGKPIVAFKVGRSEADAKAAVSHTGALAMPELMSNAINSCLGSTDKPVLAYISPHAPKIGALLTQGGVPAFSAPESCSAALGAMLHAAQWKAQPQTATAKNTIQLDKIPAGALDEALAKQLFAKFGISCANEIVVTNAEQAAQAATKLGNRVVLKILSSEILHKSDMGGVTAELLKDTTMRLLPATGGLTPETARDMAMELKTWPLLDGYRGRAPADVDALVAAIVAFSEMVAQLGEKLVEAEINPLFVLERGQSVKAADGIAVFEA